MAIMRFCTKHAVNYHSVCPTCESTRVDGVSSVPYTHEMGVVLSDPPRPVLSRFAALMEAKLKKNDHKNGWRQLPIEALFKMLMLELEEFKLAHEFLGSDEARKELVDVANFCMILHDRLGMEEDKHSGITK